MSRHDDIPQTAQEALRCGWAWLTVRCQSCRHGRDFRFDEIARRTGTGRLSAFAARLSCGKCRSRALEFSLGLNETGAGQPWTSRRPIAFEGERAVRASRE